MKGVTLLLAVLVASVALSVGVGIFSLLFAELEISGTAKDSVTAFYAADSGLECVLYWDLLENKDSSKTNPFATSGAGANSIKCANATYLVGGPGSCLDGPCTNAKSEFYLQFANANTKSCSHITVTKKYVGGILQTDMTSAGENRDRCDTDPASLRTVQQGAEIIY